MNPKDLERLRGAKVEILTHVGAAARCFRMKCRMVATVQVSMKLPRGMRKEVLCTMHYRELKDLLGPGWGLQK